MGGDSMSTTTSSTSAGSSIECGSCGAQVPQPVERVSFACPYCQSNIVDTATLHQHIDRLIPFIVDQKAALGALERYLSWERLPWSRKRGLSARRYKIEAWWIPAFVDRGTLECRYQAQVGVHWQEMVQRRVGKETRMEMVQRTEWFSLSASAAFDIDGYLSLGNPQLKEEYFRALGPFDVMSAVPVQEEILAGTVALVPDRAAPPLGEEFRAKLQERYIQEIEWRLLPGDVGQVQHCSSHFESESRAVFLLPLWRIEQSGGPAVKGDEASAKDSRVWWVHGQNTGVVGPSGGHNPYIWIVVGLLVLALLVTVGVLWS